MDEKKWQIVNKFLNKYKDKDYFEGAVLSGSYASGNYNENSDIDVYIIANDTINWKERGMKLIDGQLVEYFINPISFIKKSLIEGQSNSNCLDIRMLSNCIIVEDKHSIIENLLKEANTILEKGPTALDEYSYKINCYMVWSRFDELEIKYKRKEDIEFNYNVFLSQVITSYLKNKRIYLVNLCKIENILKDEQFKKNYNIGKDIDNEFQILLLNCFKEKDYEKRFKCAKKLYNYFKNEFSDFDINNFSVRTQI